MKNLQVETRRTCQRLFLQRVSLYGLFCSTGPYSPLANPPDSISCTVDYLLYILLSPNSIYANLAVQYNLQFLSVWIWAMYLLIAWSFSVTLSSESQSQSSLPESFWRLLNRCCIGCIIIMYFSSHGTLFFHRHKETLNQECKTRITWLWITWNQCHYINPFIVLNNEQSVKHPFRPEQSNYPLQYRWALGCKFLRLYRPVFHWSEGPIEYFLISFVVATFLPHDAPISLHPRD